MTREWTKTGEGNYSFFVNGENVGALENKLASNEALASLNENKYIIKRSGFWKNTIEVKDSNGNFIAKIYHEKWYANSFILEFKNKQYKLFIRNNPLAEWVISDSDIKLLAYGLNTSEGKVGVKITSATTNNDLLLDYILWYLFLPIATENCSNDLVFFMLLLG